MDNKELVNNLIVAFNTQNIEDFMALLTDDVKAHWVHQDKHSIGANQVQQTFSQAFTYDSEGQLEIDQILEESEYVVVVERFTKSAVEEYQNLKVVVVYQFRNAKICEFWNYL